MNPDQNQVTALVPVEGDRHPVPVPEKKEGYWGRMANRYARISRILLIVLPFFIVLFMLLFSRLFTIDSMFSFFKDMQTISAFVPSDQSTVNATYESGEHTALPYRGGIAFVNSGGVEIYAPDGSRQSNVERDFKNPRAVASRKYLVAYDQGGTAFSVNNSYAELFLGETEYAILGAEVSDSGHFALITEADRTDPEQANILSCVLIYDNNFNLIQRISRGTSTVGVSISDNGKYVACWGATARDGAVLSRLDVYRVGQGGETEEIKPVLSKELPGEMPLAIGFTDSRNIVLLTDRHLRCCELDGDVETEIALDGTPVGFEVNQNGALLALQTDPAANTHRVIALGTGGKVSYDKAFSGDIVALSLGDDELFLLTGAAVTRIDCDSGAVQSVAIESGADDLFVVDDRQIRVVYPAKAVYVKFENS